MNRSVLLLLCLVVLFAGIVEGRRRFRPKFDYDFQQKADVEDNPRIWAVLVAGSSGWYNYRHQADVAHSYQLLVNHGIAPSNIITMMFDDIANNPLNPYPGKLFNKPGGKDVYRGIKIDYKGEDVTPENFIAILEGNHSAIRGGNGRVLESDETDHVFVYFTDHGAVGLIAFPQAIMTVKTLNDSLISMYRNGRFAQLTFYLEACESGSMFEKVLPTNISIYAISAANSHESSWGTYCDNTLKLPCLGDLFSVNWMQDSDAEDLQEETLQKQFEIVKKATNLSHVMHFGDLSIAHETVANFQGFMKGPSIARSRIPTEAMISWPVRDIPLLMLRSELVEAGNDEEEAEAIQHKINKLLHKRGYLEEVIAQLITSLIHDPINRRRMLQDHPAYVENVECHHLVTHAFNRLCFSFSKNPYAMKYVYVLANLCQELQDPELIIRRMHNQCLDVSLQNIH